MFSTLTLKALTILAPIIYFLVMIFVAIAIGSSDKGQTKYDKVLLLKKVNLFVILVSALTVVLIYLINIFNFNLEKNLFYLDKNYWDRIVLIIVLFALFTYMTRNFLIDAEIFIYEYFIFCMFFVFSAAINISASSFLVLYLGLQIEATVSYFLLMVDNPKTMFNNKLAIVYLIFNLTLSLVFLYGMSVVYGATGTLRFDKIGALLTAKDFTNSAYLEFGLSFIFIYFVFKVLFLPMFFWFNGFDRINVKSILLFIFIVGILSNLFIFENFYDAILSHITLFKTLAFYFAIPVMLFFSIFMFIKKEKMLTDLVYGHLSFFIAIMFINIIEQQHFSFFLSCIIYGVQYLLFANILGNIKLNNEYIEHSSQLRGIIKSSPYYVLLISSVLIIYSYFPPTLGFVSFFYVIYSLLGEGRYFIIFLLFIIFCFMNVKYLTIVYTFFDRTSKEEIKIRSSLSFLSHIITIVVTFFSMFAIFFFYLYIKLF